MNPDIRNRSDILRITACAWMQMQSGCHQVATPSWQSQSANTCCLTVRGMGGGQLQFKFDALQEAAESRHMCGLSLSEMGAEWLLLLVQHRAPVINALP